MLVNKDDLSVYDSIMYEYKELTQKLMRAMSEDEGIKVPAIRYLYDVSYSLGELQRCLKTN